VHNGEMFLWMALDDGAGDWSRVEAELRTNLCFEAAGFLDGNVQQSFVASRGHSSAGDDGSLDVVCFWRGCRIVGPVLAAEDLQSLVCMKKSHCEFTKEHIYLIGL
jgi:hypothetical protein